MSGSKKHQSKSTDAGIVCFSGTDWWYHNRGLFCPQIMTRLAKDYKVLYVNSLGIRVPSLTKDPCAAKKIFRKLRSMLRFLRKSKDGMWIMSPISLPLGSRIGRKINNFSVFLQVKLATVLLGFREPIVYIGCPPALKVVEKLRKKYVIYERSDLYEEMPGTNSSYIAYLDNELTRSSNLVLYMNRALWTEGIKKNRNSLLIGHGVDFDFFVNAVKSERIPEDIARISHPIVGWFGDIDNKTSDIVLLEYVAEKLPDMSIVFIGPVSVDVSRLKELPNVHFLGQKPYDQIPSYGKEFDVAIMAWNRNKWIEFCNPIKIKEYLALGKPIVSTYYPEIEPYSDIVYIAQDYDAFVSCIHKAVKEHDSAKAEERRERVRNETWNSKVEQIRAAIEKGLSQDGCPRSGSVVQETASVNAAAVDRGA